MSSGRGSLGRGVGDWVECSGDALVRCRVVVTSDADARGCES